MNEVHCFQTPCLRILTCKPPSKLHKVISNSDIKSPAHQLQPLSSHHHHHQRAASLHLPSPVPLPQKMWARFRIATTWTPALTPTALTLHCAISLDVKHRECLSRSAPAFLSATSLDIECRGCLPQFAITLASSALPHHNVKH